MRAASGIALRDSPLRTTLVEQTLSARPNIAAGDELPLIRQIAAIMPRMLASPLDHPDALAELWMGDQCERLDNPRDHYLQKVRQPGAWQRPEKSRRMVGAVEFLPSLCAFPPYAA